MHRTRLLFVAFLCASLVSTALPNVARADRVKVLILGDSVASVLRWSPTSMKSLWKAPYEVTLEVWGCQKLVDPGCIEGDVPQASTLQLIRKHRNDDFDIVVVMAGYNDTGAPYLQKSIKRIHSEVKTQGAHLMWLTYRENGNVRIKARAFNKVVKTQAKKLGYSVLDWELISRIQKHWFTGDSVHMNAHGGVRLGNHIRRALDSYLSTGSVATSTTTTVVSTTVPSS